MSKDHSADLMQSLVAKLYKTITGNDQSIKMPRNKFVTWMLPGIPFSESDFLFCAKGLSGSSAEETRELYHQAFILSKFFDYIPEVNNEFMDATMQETIFSSTQDTISSVYSDVLKYSRVVNMELSKAEQEKLIKYRNLLTIEKEETDLITDETRKVTEPGPLTLAYNAKLNDYLDAADEYVDLLTDAQSATGNSPEAIRRVQEFANKSKFLKKKVESAYMAWVSQGYKNEYEQINAYIDQLSMKSMLHYKDDLLKKFRNSILTSPADGPAAEFPYTTIVPGNFATSQGWTKFTYYDGDYANHYQQKTSQWSAGGKGSFGLFSAKASASGTKIAVAENQQTRNLSAEFEFTQVPIIRPWFDPGFFSMKGWILDQLWDLNFPGKKVSDGAEVPAGRLVAYPITALFVRNVKMSFDENASQSEYVKKTIAAGGSAGWGPFKVGGKYSRGSETRDFKSEFSGGKVNVPGMQLIGFVNNLVPKSPDPNPNLKPEQFVGGVQQKKTREKSLK